AAVHFLTMLRLFAFSYLLSFASAGLIGSAQSIAVSGKLMCNDKPAGHVKIKLFDEDSLYDDKLDEGESAANGIFRLAGTDNEVTRLDPKINIYHDCDDGLTPCQRRITIFIPKKYISKGQIATQTYDAGVIQLAGKFAGEKRDCIN
ncbi:hypothetical protein PENTCL1PPCAC_7996, partial [Pristionchus entomophagus]